jgi:tetratricopeptide (TPR) repeat protein
LIGKDRTLISRVMADPVNMLLFEIEAECARLPGAVLSKAASGEARLARLTSAIGRAAPAGYAAFVTRYDGGSLTMNATNSRAVGTSEAACDPGLRILTLDESARRAAGPERAAELKGLWPVAERGLRLFALDCEAEGEGECPVVEVAGRSVDRVGSSFLRFIYACLGELLAGESAEPSALIAELCRRDPALAEHWVHLVDHLEAAGDKIEVDRALAEALRCSSPPGPALLTAVALRALDQGDLARAQVALDDALGLEPLTARDDDARLDAAAVSLVLSQERGDGPAVARAKELLGVAAASTGAFWRGEAIRSHAAGDTVRATLAGKVVEALVPGDSDMVRMRESSTNLQTALRALATARDSLDQGAFDEAMRQARIAVNERPDLAICHLVLAESLNASHERGALDAATRATELNPALVDSWRELGDAHLEARQAVRAEEAYRQAIQRDASFAPGFAKLAQALLEQGRMREALEAINIASERGGDSFFVAAVRGDILSEMNRHHEAAEAYDEAMHIEPEDHWVLHQAAREHCRAGHDDRAAELFERALRFDRDGCHQTLVDYGDLLRRVGRIGDAVRMYRKAVAACPNDVEWRRVLREAERELMSAPS